MSKSILISIKPEWVAKILNGEKTIEIRKTMPKCDLPIDVYIYCTKDKKLAWYKDCLPIQKWNDKYHILRIERLKDHELNGKVVAKFTLKKCEEWHNYSWFEITEKGCVSDDELRNYSKGKASLYIWHIDNLKIFDKPKELSEFIQSKRKNYEEPQVQKAPQSWCYVEAEKLKGEILK